MLYLYLDESGDLGFDFVNKKPSKFFTMTILAVSGVDQNRKLINAAKKTTKRKLNTKHKIFELKGAAASIEVKTYFYKQVKNIEFDLYSVSINKKKLLWKLIENKARIYSFIAREIIDQIPFDEETRVEFVIDKSKGKSEIEEFNNYIKQHLEAKIKPSTIIDIYHWDSKQNYGLQACDFFCSGIFQSHERKENTWKKIFEKEKIKYDKVLEK